LCAGDGGLDLESILHNPRPAVVGPYVLVGALGGFVMAMVTVFKKNGRASTAPIYALLEGYSWARFRRFLELRFPGIAIQAVALTFGTCICLLLAYRSGLIRATEKFKIGIVAATGGIAVVLPSEHDIGAVRRSRFQVFSVAVRLGFCLA